MWVAGVWVVGPSAAFPSLTALAHLILPQPLLPLLTRLFHNFTVLVYHDWNETHIQAALRKNPLLGESSQGEPGHDSCVCLVPVSLPREPVGFNHIVLPLKDLI